eukprot:1363357-Amorphochlora_amoeboformis.AAC.1
MGIGNERKNVSTGLGLGSNFTFSVTMPSLGNIAHIAMDMAALRKIFKKLKPDTPVEILYLEYPLANIGTQVHASPTSQTFDVYFCL